LLAVRASVNCELISGFKLPLPEGASEADVEAVKNGELPMGLPEAQEPGGFSFDEDGLPAS